jgi:hypothetical protein
MEINGVKLNEDLSISVPQKPAIIKNMATPTTVLAKGTSAGWVPSEGEGIAKHAKQFRKQAGGVPLQERSPAA